jgi:hypothetical protein
LFGGEPRGKHLDRHERISTTDKTKGSP